MKFTVETVYDLRALSAMFHPEQYETATAAGTTCWPYDRIGILAETEAYFAFVFSTSHAQVYAKKGLCGGSEEEFRQFLREVTGKEIISIR